MQITVWHYASIPLWLIVALCCIVAVSCAFGFYYAIFVQNKAPTPDQTLGCIYIVSFALVVGAVAAYLAARMVS